jgi:hypothetical protein
MHGTGWADARARRIAALLTHHWNRNTFSLPGINMDARRSKSKLLFFFEATGNYAILTACALIGMDHDEFCHRYSSICKFLVNDVYSLSAFSLPYTINADRLR